MIIVMMHVFLAFVALLLFCSSSSSCSCSSFSDASLVLSSVS